MKKVKILITGGTGSLGRALIHRYSRQPQYDVTIIARNEKNINQVRSQHPEVRCEIGDVRDLSWLQTIFPGHHLVIHAAALKVVPTAEVNVRETILTNVYGSENVAKAAVDAKIKRVIGVSTDKACEVQTIYGSTKMLMEGLFREADNWSEETSFNLVRYGNVLRSNQSVVPFFERLIREGKPLTVTQLDMTRFWLSMNDAIDLIEYAIRLGDSGLVIVPKAKSTTMQELAEWISPEGYPIKEIGIRPGEKVHEKMVHAGETLHTEDAGKYFHIHHPSARITNHILLGTEYTSLTCEKMTREELYQKLNEYNPQNGSVYG